MPGLWIPVLARPGQFPSRLYQTSAAFYFGDFMPQYPSVWARTPEQGALLAKITRLLSCSVRRLLCAPPEGMRRSVWATELNPSSRATWTCAGIPHLTARLHCRQEHQPFAWPLPATQGPESALEPPRVRLLGLNELQGFSLTWVTCPASLCLSSAMQRLPGKQALPPSAQTGLGFGQAPDGSFTSCVSHSILITQVFH